MLAFHACWGPDRRLHVWAEDADAFDDAAPEMAAPGADRVPAHPFAASAAALAAALPVVAGEPGRLAVRLPSIGRRPGPSPTLPVTPPPGETGEATWVVPLVAFEPRAAAAVFLDPPPAVAASRDASLRFSARLARLALEVVARGRVLPAIERDGRGPATARWSAAPGAGDRTRVASLARAMPASWLAASAATPSAELALSEALDEFVDAAVRDLLATARLPKRSGRRTIGARLADALAGPDRRLELAEALDLGVQLGAYETLARGFREWAGRAAPAEGPLRTVFRLVEPETPQAPAAEAVEVPVEPWRLEILMSPRTEPSLLVGAAQIWRDRSVLARAAGGSDPEDALLGDLGRASRLYPALETALEEARPAALLLDDRGAHAFLREAAPLLAEAGFGVLVPGWWGSRRARLGLRVHARGRRSKKTTVGPVVGQQAVAEYELRVALGDTELTEAELHALVELKAPLVRVRGEWIEIRPEEIEAALRVASRSKSAPATMSVAELLAAAGGSVAGLPVVGVEASGWLERIVSGDARAEAIPTPVGFDGALRPYQERGLGWLAFLDSLGLGACLADDMGLGKTAQLLALLVAERAPVPGGAPPGPTLVVCPMSVVGNWQKEAARFAPSLRVVVHHGGGRLTTPEDLARAVAEADLVITTYGLLARDESALKAVPWRRIVLDEAQAIKNAETRQAQAARALGAAGRVALTGTPVENRLTELWSIMDFCNPGLLGPEGAFRERFAVPIEQRGDAEQTERLRRLTSPFILRRIKTDPEIVPELPRKLEMTVPCNLTVEQASLYAAVVEDMLETIDRAEGIRRRGLVLQAIARLKQICNHPAHFQADGSFLTGRSGKLSALEGLLEDAVAAGDATLVFTQFTEWAGRLVPYLRERFGREVLYLHGGTPRPERDRLVERFQSGAAPVFVLSLTAGGRGLNLTAATQVVHYDRWWNPAVEDQASDRAYRIGQTREVQVRRLVCLGTIEERIAEMHEAKRGLAERVVGTGEAWLTELSTAELRELFTLAPDAVAEA